MTADADAGRPVEDWSAAIKRASGAGDHLLSVDISARALREHPDSLLLEYLHLLAFARSGATRRAEIQLGALERSGRLAAVADERLRVDFAALKGRLLKDRAIRATDPSERKSLAGQSALAYERAFEATRSCFPAVNAATLWQIADDPVRAVAMARAALLHAQAETDPYWKLATEAEALIVLSDESAAATALADAAVAGRGRLDAIASTRRQLGWLATVTGLGVHALAAMPVPQVVHWLADPLDAAGQTIELPAAVADNGQGLVAFGSLLSTADIATAEALHRRDAQLHLILPCAAKVCRDFLTGRGGPAVADRFDRLLDLARGVATVTPEGDPGEATVLTLAVMQARGHALLRARSLVVPVQVLLCGDAQVELRDPADPAVDLRRVLAGWPDRSGGNPVWSGRTVRAIVFGDVQGFSSISEVQHAAFLETVLGGFADALAPLEGHVEYAETAGDGLYLVLSDVISAVRACHALHLGLEPARLAAAGLPTGLALRLSAHVGPVFQGLDRVIHRQKFFGKEVIRTARIEPVTPPGETYVTEQFAAVLYCETGDAFECEYVGHQPMAKGFGECRMYSLRSSAPVAGLTL